MFPKLWFLLVFLLGKSTYAVNTPKGKLNRHATFSFRNDIIKHHQHHQRANNESKRGEIDSSLSSAFSELQPEGPPQIVNTESSKKFKISQQLYNKLSALKLNGKNEVITLPGVVNVYGPPPKGLGIPQAQEPLNIIATPHLTKFRSYHKFNFLPVTFKGEVNPINLYTNRKPVEVNTGKPKHLFLPFSPRRRNPFSRFYKGLPMSNFIRKHSRYVHLLPHRRIFTTTYKQPIPEFRSQPYEEEAALARQVLPSYARTQQSPELVEALKNVNARPRYIDGGPPIEKFMPGRELTLPPNEDVDLRHLNFKDGNFQTIPTYQSRVSPDETANERSPGVELFTVNKHQAPQEELTNHGLEQIPNTIQSPDTMETSSSAVVDNRDIAANIEAPFHHIGNNIEHPVIDSMMGGDGRGSSDEHDKSRQVLDHFDSHPPEGVMDGLDMHEGGFDSHDHHSQHHHFSKSFSTKLKYGI